MSNLRAGIWGRGPDGLWSAAQMRRQDECELVVAGDSEPGTRFAFTGETGIRHHCSSFAELLGTGIDLVVLAGPRRERLAQVQAAAEQGVHCLLHAPMALSGADADQMVAHCEAAAVQLGVLVRGQEDPVFEQLRQMIASDWLGGVVHVQCLAGEDGLLRTPPATDDPRLLALIANHPLLQLAAHHAHLATWLTGKLPVAATAQVAKGFLPLPADGAVATVQFKGGVLCTLAVSHLLAANQFAIHGTDGFVRIAGDRIVLKGRTEYRGDVFDYLTQDAELALLRRDVDDAAERQAGRCELHARFARWIDDRDDFPCSGEQAAADMAIFDAIAEATKSGKAEPIRRP
ncbi:MAG: Gfo/Idh/MocA family oxidoreductase [bacterium]|nr:Gfo/Idh/MocA family oxidoreductase [bacterium]